MELPFSLSAQDVGRELMSQASEQEEEGTFNVVPHCGHSKRFGFSIRPTMTLNRNNADDRDHF